MNIPNGYDEIRAVYGDPKPRDMGQGQLTVCDAWESANMSLAHIPGYDRALYMHELIIEDVWNILKAAQARRPDYKLVKLGCFAPRMKKTIKNGKIIYRTDAYSLHTWGIALDINPDTNQFGSKTWDMPSEYVEEFERLGWVWGGRWKTVDPMHFQRSTGA